MKNKKHLAFLSFVLTFILCTGTFRVAVSQSVDTYLFSQSMGTYTPISGTVIVPANSDDVSSTLQAIGFTFVYDGNYFTTFAANSNGSIRLGALPSSVSAYTPLSSLNNTNAIAPLGRDGRSFSGVSFNVTGAVGSRVLTIQYANQHLFWSGVPGTNFSVLDVQIKLFESSNAIQFVYQTVTPSAIVQATQIGIRGATTVNFQNRTNTFSASTPGLFVTSTMAVGAGNTPVNGQTYTWNPQPPSDYDLSLIGLPQPLATSCTSSNLPCVVTVRNNGLQTWDFSVHPATVSVFTTGAVLNNPLVTITLNSGSLTPGQTQDVQLTTNLNLPNGTTRFRGIIQAAADTSNYNDSLRINGLSYKDILISTFSGAFPYIQNFNTFPSPVIQVQQVSGTGNWSFVTSGSLSFPQLNPSNPGFAYFNSFNFASNTSSRLVLPCMDFSSLNMPAVTFRMSQSSNYSNATTEGVYVVVSTDGGQTWSNSLYFAPRYNPAVATAPNSAVWSDFIVNLCAYAGMSDIRVGLTAVSNFGDNIAIDGLQILNASNCNNSIYYPMNTLIHGMVFGDVNNNGIMDINENTLTGVAISANCNGNLFTTQSMSNGYQLMVDTGNVQVNSGNQLYYTSSLPSVSVYLNSLINDTIINFPYVPTPGVRDVSISAVPLVPFRPGFWGTLGYTVKNLGTDTASGHITIQHPTTLTYNFSTLTPLNVYSDSVTFPFTNLLPGQLITFYVKWTVAPPPAVNIGNVLSFNSIAYPLSIDANTSNNFIESNYTVVGSFDPNGKYMQRGNFFTTQQIANGEYFEYYVGFQNTGTDTAFFVNLYDTLDTQLDWNTFEMLAYSHPCHLQINNQRNLHWYFPNILLPDSNTNEPASHGYVIYRIKPQPFLVHGNMVPNVADIVFDYNLPVRTNLSEVFIMDPTAVKSSYNNDILVQPNPFHDRFSLSPAIGTIRSVDVVDIAGRLIHCESEPETMPLEINAEMWKSGMYMVRVCLTDGNTLHTKLVKD